jgi:flagellar motility protein MotE (MotC chaperone)
MIKNRFLTAFAAAALLGAGAPAFAKTQDSQPANSEGASSAKGERKICKRFDHSTSRLLSESVCFTKSDWKKFNSLN